MEETDRGEGEGEGEKVWKSNYDGVVVRSLTKRLATRGRLQCKICDTKFRFRDRFKRHMREYHNWCIGCGGQISPDNMDAHQAQCAPLLALDRQEAMRFKCSICHELFPHATMVKIHQQQVHGVQPLPHFHRSELFPCKICGKKLMKQHMKRHVELHSTPKTVREPNSFMCEICAKTFNVKTSLLAHIEKKHTNPRKKKPQPRPDVYRCKKCSEEFPTPGKLMYHRNKAHGQEFLCELCPQTCINKFSLETHMRTHTGVRPYSCVQCQRRFNTASTLKKHQISHSSHRPFSCQLCPAAFARRDKLRHHVQRVHEKLKPYQCEYCQRRFADRGMLVTHTRSHTGHKPYCCDLCDAQFARGDYLKKHKATHARRGHTNAATRSDTHTGNTNTTHKHFLCTEKSTHAPHSATNNRTHSTWFTCGVCTVSFTDRDMLLMHMNTHTDCSNSQNSVEHSNSLHEVNPSNSPNGEPQPFSLFARQGWYTKPSGF